MASAQISGDADLAALGSVLGERARARMLLALGDGRALPAGVLASEAGVAASTASQHLGRLVDAGLLAVVPQGRHRYYRLAGPQVAELIEALARVAPAAPVRSLREGTRAHAIRTARTCYDHLAGRLGVSIMQALIAEGAVTGGDGLHHFDGDDRLSAPGRDVDYRLTRAGASKAGAARDRGRRGPPAALLRRLDRAGPPPLRPARPRARRSPARARLAPPRRPRPRRPRHRRRRRRPAARVPPAPCARRTTPAARE